MKAVVFFVPTGKMVAESVSIGPQVYKELVERFEHAATTMQAFSMQTVGDLHTSIAPAALSQCAIRPG